MKKLLSSAHARLLLSILIICAVVFIEHNAKAETVNPGQTKKKLVLGADEWCPYNCIPGSSQPGYVVELAKAIFEQKGYDVEYKVMPWEQAKADTLHGRISGAIGMNKNEGDETERIEDPTGKKKFKYPQSEIAVSAVSFFVDRYKAWKFDPSNPDTSLSALGGKVGIAEGYDYALNDKLNEKNMLVEVGGVNPLQDLMLMLRAGKIEAFIDDRNAVSWKLARLRLGLKIIEAGIAEEPECIYVGFCPECEQEAEIFSQGIVELRSTGKLQEILSNYHLTDWQKK